ncbi:MAG: hypothetical protein KAR19_17810 [Bacteroidales bacterium]|nr:hypothetical protein [Bacteroidales bacterium]
MVKTTIDYKKALLWGAIVWVIQMLVGNLLWMNPIVANINQQYAGHPTIKSFDFIGGMSNWILVTLLFGTVFIIVCIILYLILYRSLPGQGWKKGLFFGLMVGFIKAVPEAFNQWMLFVYPESLILVQLANTLIGFLIFGTLLGFFYKKFNVIISE